MLAYDRVGTGPPLLLLHGTNSSRDVWKPLLPALSASREVIAVDMPGHGESPASSFAPPDWAREVAALMDRLGLERVSVVGHSAGGWTALELAKLGRASGVLALAPAGLWRRHSPLVTDTLLVLNWRVGQLLGERALRPLRFRSVRAVSLRQVSGRPAHVPADVALQLARSALRSKHFPEHFRATRRLRFLGGREIPADVAVHLAWGAKDWIARRRRSRHTEELPAQTRVETWEGCGHMIMWDAPERVIAGALELN
jgi:pimeloyl-ACP methyl ester carboxylesterase